MQLPIKTGSASLSCRTGAAVPPLAAQAAIPTSCNVLAKNRQRTVFGARITAERPTLRGGQLVGGWVKRRRRVGHPPGRGGQQVISAGVFDIFTTTGGVSKAKVIVAGLKWPEKMVIGNMQTNWALSDGWIILAYFLAVKPTLIILFSLCHAIMNPYEIARRRDVLLATEVGKYHMWSQTRVKALVRLFAWNIEKYNSSWVSWIHRPLMLLAVPIAINFLIDTALNVLFTYKLVKTAQLKKVAAIAMQASRVSFIVWGGAMAFYLKNRMLGPMFARSKAGRQILPALSKLMSIGLFVGVSIAVLKMFGFSQESLGLAGVTAGAVAFAAQSFLREFLTSLVLCNPEAPFEVGDFVSVKGATGAVTRIGWFNTTICCPEGPTVYIPNSQILGANVLSITRSEYRRMDESFPVIAEDPRKVFDAVEEIRTWIANSGLTIPDKDIHVHIWGAHGSGLTLRLECCFAGSGGRIPTGRRAELDGRHAVMKAVVEILAKHQCVIWAVRSTAKLPADDLTSASSDGYGIP